MIDSLIECKIILLHFFKNPLIYWVILLSLLIAKKRGEIEVNLFQQKVTRTLLEWYKTILPALLAGLVLSFITLNIGLVISYEAIVFFCITSLVLTFLFHFKYLSAAYTIGLTYILLTSSIQNHYENSIVILASLTFLIGFFLIYEGIFLKGMKNRDSSPEMATTNRGGLFGQLRINRVSLIPFFIFVPSGVITPLFPLWPTLTIGEEAYAIALIPFIVGVNYLFHGTLPKTAILMIANRTIILGASVIALTIISLFIPTLSLFIVFIALIGKGLIQYFAYIGEVTAAKIFLDKNNQITVFWIVPGSPAAKLGMRIGDTILKVNEHDVHSKEEFYELIMTDEKIVQIHILNAQKQPRIINGTLLTKCEEKTGLVLI